ncbi:hypothetical protein K7432_016295 [Basidiobolus ranarum]|uniref:Uncharacterized protein n=1 Tax=Basidiobolus ranarum TaxID=34480 RepID=A0ABR2WEX8_9FUNG
MIIDDLKSLHERYHHPTIHLLLLSMLYSLEEVLSAGVRHPLYASLRYPSKLDLAAIPLLDKVTLYNQLQYAINSDKSILQSAYLSPTGGTSDGPLLYFITDTDENRAQREEMGRLMNEQSVITKEDIVLVLQGGKYMYRSLDLICELIDNSHGTALAAGASTSSDILASLAIQFGANAISGTCTQMINFAQYIEANGLQSLVKFDKIFYTSEVLPVHQEYYLRTTFGASVITSVYGSAEGGVWAACGPAKLGQGAAQGSNFVYDKKMMIVEILKEDGTHATEGEKGEIVLTSLMRLRNPLIRYCTGDLGSLHAYRGDPLANGRSLAVLRLYGRNPVKSVNFQGEYFNPLELEQELQKAEWNILDWQAVFEGVMGKRDTVVFRIIFRVVFDNIPQLLHQKMVELLEVEHHEDVLIEPVTYDQVEKGRTGAKMKRFIDRRHYSGLN